MVIGYSIRCVAFVLFVAFHWFVDRVHANIRLPWPLSPFIAFVYPQDDSQASKLLWLPIPSRFSNLHRRLLYPPYHFESSLLAPKMSILFAAAPLQNYTSSSNATAPTWVSAPSGRGTWGILGSCLSTLGLCVWKSLHLNVPAMDESD